MQNLERRSRRVGAKNSLAEARFEKEFQKMIRMLIAYKGKNADTAKEILKGSFLIQQNRSEVHRLLGQKVYKNEWILMSILFTITISFILIIQTPELLFVELIPPILCAGLAMLIVVLFKMSALTHKRAKTIWTPLHTLRQTKFYQIYES